MAARNPQRPQDEEQHQQDNEEEVMLDAADVDEEIDEMEDDDAPMGGMDGDDDDEPIVEGGGVEEAMELQNDSIAHFDLHKDSIFTISSHPKQPLLVATGSGDDSAYIWSADPQPDLLPRSFQQQQGSRAGGGVASNGGRGGVGAGDGDGGGDGSTAEPGRASLIPLAQLKGHTDTVLVTAFSQPNGDYLLTAGMDGRVRVYTAGRGGVAPRDAAGFQLVAEAQEVEEITWLSVCPSRDRPNTFAFGGNDGSVWVYEIIDQGASPAAKAELQMVQVYYQHTTPCTAGTWSLNGALLATVSEESSLYVFDPFGLVPGATGGGSTAVVSLTAADQRFEVEGGLYSVAITPGGTLCAVGGHGGSIRVVGLPRTATDPAATPSLAGSTTGQKGGQGARAKAGGGKQVPASSTTQQTGGGQAGQIVASLSTGGDSVETLAFSPTGALLATGDVDGNLRLFETGRNFALRKHVPEAHENQAVVGFAWEGAGLPPAEAAAAAVAAGGTSVLFSCGMDGVLKKWDARTGSLLREYKGHRGGGEGGGIMGFVVVRDEESGRSLAVTAGDDSVGLVFDVTA